MGKVVVGLLVFNNPISLIASIRILMSWTPFIGVAQIIYRTHTVLQNVTKRSPYKCRNSWAQTCLIVLPNKFLKKPFHAWQQCYLLAADFWAILLKEKWSFSRSFDGVWEPIVIESLETYCNWECALNLISCYLLSGLNTGCFYSLSTLLNRMVLQHYPVCDSVQISRHCLLLQNIDSCRVIDPCDLRNQRIKIISVLEPLWCYMQMDYFSFWCGREACAKACALLVQSIFTFWLGQCFICITNKWSKNCSLSHVN